MRVSLYSVAPVCSMPPYWKPGRMIKLYLANGYGIPVYSSSQRSDEDTCSKMTGFVKAVSDVLIDFYKSDKSEDQAPSEDASKNE